MKAPGCCNTPRPEPAGKDKFPVTNAHSNIRKPRAWAERTVDEYIRNGRIVIAVKP